MFWICFYFFFFSAKFQLGPSQLSRAATAETAFSDNHCPLKLKTSTFDQSGKKTKPGQLKDKYKDINKDSPQRISAISRNKK